MLLEDFGDDWDSRINWVRNHKHESFGCSGSNSGGEIADDSGIDLLEIEESGEARPSG